LDPLTERGRPLRRVLRRIFKILLWLIIAALVWVLTPLDGIVTRQYADPSPTFLRYSATAPATSKLKTAFVFFTGMQTSGETQSAPLREAWSKHGDVIVVEYNRIHFDGPVTAYKTQQKLHEWGYDRAILDGASLGGLLATDVIDYDQALHGNLKFAVMMQDTPLGRDDLYNPDGADLVSKVWWPGYVSNALFTDAFWYFGFDPPPHYKLGTGIDEQQLAAHYAVSSSYPLSGWKDEVRYILKHRGFIRNQYIGIPLVVMESENDAMVKSTFARWKIVFGDGTLVKVPQTTHVGFVEYPDRWRAAYDTGFKALPGW
jgi:hypothetical protein